MADGMAGGNVQAVEIVRVRKAQGYGYAYAPLGERMSPFSGNANPAAKREKFALAPWRTARFAFVATPSTVGGVDYLTVREGTVSLFNVGTGGAYTAANGGCTGVASDAESMAGQQGAIVRDGATFVAVGLEIRREAAWYTPEASAADQLGNRYWPDWISENTSSGFDYTEELRKQIEPAAFFRYQLFPNVQIQENRCGALRDWMAPPDSGRLGKFGNFPAFTSEYGSGGQKTSAQLQSFITLGENPARLIRVQERAGLALPADGAVVLEYSQVLWGYTVCGDPPSDDICAMPGVGQMGSAVQLFAQLTEARRMYEAGVMAKAAYDALSAQLNNAMAQLPG